MSGIGKDSRFLEDNMWATKPMRPKSRPNLGSHVTDSDAGTAKPAPKLDGTGAWGDWGVKKPPSLTENDKDDYVQGSPVPCTIDGMNRVLEQRVRAASAKSAAAYARASPSAGVKAEKVTAPSGDSTGSSPQKNKFIPPHKRKLLAAHVPSPGSANTPNGTPVTAPSGADDNILALLQGMVKERSMPAKDPVQNSANLIMARPAPGTHFTVPMDSEARRPSSTTLVNAASDDETVAKQLQAKEFGLVRMDDVCLFLVQVFNVLTVQAQEILLQGLQHHKTSRKTASTSPSPSGVKEAALYTRLHKIQEVSWKQEMMNLPDFTKSKNDLFNMGEEFSSYYENVRSAHLAQWNCGALNDVFKELRNVSAVRPSSPSDQFILTDDDLNSLEDSGEQEFDSDGFGPSGEEDEDEDGPVVFKGRG
jgi:hypothetical protein